MPDEEIEGPNPYVPPTASLERPEPAGVAPDAVALRCAYLGRESFLKALGLAYLVSAAINGLVFSLALLVFSIHGKLEASKVPLPERYQAAQLLTSLIGAPASFLWYFALGWGLRKLRRWAFWGHFLSATFVVVVLFVSIIRGDSGKPGADNFGRDLLCFVVMAAQMSILVAQIARPNWWVVGRDYRAAVAETPHLVRRLRWPYLLGVVPLTIVVMLGGWAMMAYVAWKLAPMLTPFFHA